ncbi:hypothetical protein ADL27_53680, partial [Streptomyces sp. NRRL F-6602]
ADARLTTRRAWLHGAASGRTALLLSYGAAGKAPELTLPVGLAMEAELTWFPRGTGGRAELGERFDVVLLASFLVHAGDAEVRRGLLRTCLRHLAPGGTVL